MFHATRSHLRGLKGTLPQHILPPLPQINERLAAESPGFFLGGGGLCRNGELEGEDLC